ncbi:MAG: hypothetical protein ACAH21_08890 [Ramlibacter sp.]|nr:hypothetical protein [Ramlibacter sp.]
MKTLEQLAATGADARQIADASVAVWSAIDEALSPVIGPRGSGALYKRSIHLARASYPWLGAAYEGAGRPGDFSALNTALAAQTAVQAAAAHDAVLKIFHDLLADLIGRSLTQRLLQAVWDSPPNGAAAQDNPP